MNRLTPRTHYDPIPKPKRIRSRKAIQSARRKWCEWCGVYEGPGVSIEVHHIHAKGMGAAKGDDVKENLISLCVGIRSKWCHARAENAQIPREELLAIVAARQ